ncbi:MAG: hypothetical protein L0Y55_10460, partial [Anaerolineales bacterium]|nr:hypothetical protein [Anaerolineales bacterium]
MDNANPGFSIQAGEWGACKRGECSGVCYNADFRYADPSCANCRARFDLRVPNSGSYELFVWWPHGDDRATDTPFAIQFSGGTINLKVDQRNSGNDWFWLHTLNVKSGETVSVFVGGTKTGFANADAVALFPTGTLPSAAPPAQSPAAQSTTKPAQPTQVGAPQATKPAPVQPTVAPVAGKPATIRKIVFLHHSTGQGLIDQGSLRQRLTALGYEFFDHGYNDAGLTLANGQSANMNFDIPDDNTDPDGFNTLFAQPLTAPPTNAFSRLMQYDVIAFKSCFPTTNIESNQQLEEYKTYYRNIRAVMDKYPNKIFIVVSPPPNTPAETNSQNAARARAWANWLKSPEYLSGHPNIFTFDFFNLLAENNPVARDNNMLRAAYRLGDAHDSHPNERANREIGPQF